MSRWLRIACTGAVLVSISVAFYACNSVQRVDAREFTRALQRAPETMNAFLPIGVAGKRAYLEHWSMVPVFGERVTVMWTPVEELAPEVVEKVRARQ